MDLPTTRHMPASLMVSRFEHSWKGGQPDEGDRAYTTKGLEELDRIYWREPGDQHIIKSEGVCPRELKQIHGQGRVYGFGRNRWRFKT